MTEQKQLTDFTRIKNFKRYFEQYEIIRINTSIKVLFSYLILNQNFLAYLSQYMN